MADEYERQKRKFIKIVIYLLSCTLTLSFLIIIITNMIKNVNQLKKSQYIYHYNLHFDKIQDNKSVCFDYDDTIAFTTPVFVAAMKNSRHPNDMWRFVNNEYIGKLLTVNKPTVVAILQRIQHQKPNVPINVITSRCSANETLLHVDEASLTHQIIDYILPNANNLTVYFACPSMNRLNKIEAIEKFNCAMMFGDSNEDISSCILAKNGCIPYRILRSEKSTYTTDYNPELYTENIIIDSDF